MGRVTKYPSTPSPSPQTTTDLPADDEEDDPDAPPLPESVFTDVPSILTVSPPVSTNSRTRPSRLTVEGSEST